MHDSTQLSILKDFFVGTWDTNAIDRQAIAEIERLKPARILDVGCGNNLYKNYFPDLFGIDIANPRADLVTDILDFDCRERFEVIICFGSLNFGCRDDVLCRLNKVRQLLSDQGLIFMKVNPGIRWPSRPELVIYPWSPEEIERLGAEAGLEVAQPVQPRHTANGLRYTFTYRRKDA